MAAGMAHLVFPNSDPIVGVETALCLSSGNGSDGAQWRVSVAPEGCLILDDTVNQRILIMHHLTELVGLTAVARIITAMKEAQSVPEFPLR
jgi:hypothetical protein